MKMGFWRAIGYFIRINQLKVSLPEPDFTKKNAFGIVSPFRLHIKYKLILAGSVAIAC